MYGLRDLDLDWDDTTDISFPDEPVLDAVAPGALPPSVSGSGGGGVMDLLRQNKTVVFAVSGAVLLLAIMRR